MNNIFIAFIFILFNFSLDLNGHMLNLIPTFIGYWFLYKGLVELQEKCSRFTRVVSWTKGMLVFATLNWGVQLIFSDLGWGLTVLQLVEVLFNLIITYQVIVGLIEYEKERQIDIYALKLRSAWMVAIILSLLVSIFMVIPIVYQIGVVLSFIANVYVIVRLYKTKQAYNNK